MTSQDWYALGTMLLGAGVIVGGGWSLFNYHRARRTEAITWMHRVFEDFYLKDIFVEVRVLIEYDYEEIAMALVEKRITDRHVPVSTEEIALLRQLDNLLNYFEYVLYLENEGQIKREDRQAIFEYWFDIMNDGRRASLRRYIAHFGFERVAAELKVEDTPYIAVYGSLRQGFGLPDLPEELTTMLVDEGACTIEGDLYDLGDYPGLLPGRGQVVGQLFRVTDSHGAFPLLDKYERFDPSAPDHSLYIRHCVRLMNPEVDAWVYIYNGFPATDKLIKSGDWARYVGEKRDPAGSA